MLAHGIDFQTMDNENASEKGPHDFGGKFSKHKGRHGKS